MLRSVLYFFLLSFAFISCKSPEARKPVKRNTGTFIEQSADRNKVLYESEKKQIQQIIDTDSTNNYIASDNGFWYYYNVKDNTNILDTTAVQKPKPSYGDKVTFTYIVKDLNGTEILSETETGPLTYIVDKTNQELPSGIRDGIKLMKEGETVTFLFPSYKAYGYYGIENKIGANVPVQSKITLKSIEISQEN